MAVFQGGREYVLEEIWETYGQDDKVGMFIFGGVIKVLKVYFDYSFR
jgi:hypothetical protein